MPLVEKTTGGSVYLTAIEERLTVGGRVDVSEGLAEHLVEGRGDFQRVGVQDVDYEDVDDTTDEEDVEPGETEGFDAEAFVDRKPMDVVTDDIHAGDVDEHLNAVQEAAGRVGVQDAVGERRAELEG